MKRILSTALILLLATGTPSFSQDAESLLKAITSGEASGNFLLRAEGVNAESFDDPASALTLRSQLGYQTAAFRGWSAYAEFEAISAVLGDEGYANAGSGDLNNGVTDRPVIADAQAAEVNQGWVRYTNDLLMATIGRQEIIFADSRFVGNVGWRQNHQSYDAARLDVSPSDAVSGTYVYLREVHRITGQDVTVQGHVAEARVALGEMGHLTGFALLLDYPNAPAASRATFGARFNGMRALNEAWDASVETSYALQQDAFDNPGSVDASYLMAGASVNRNGSSIGLRYESLSGSSAEGSFVTPLATLHKFNGWADVFLATPADGLVDVQLSLKHTVGGTSITLIAHDFSAQDGDRHHGREFDAVLGRSLPSGQPIGLKFAHYVADETGSDVTKVWIWTRLSF